MEDNMTYSRGPEQPPLKGSVNLRGCKVFARPSSHSKEPFVFNVVTASRVFFFQASGEVRLPVIDAGLAVLAVVPVTA